MSEKIAVDLGSVQKTLFLPLWGRAFESRKEKPLLVDKTAQATIDKIDYDFILVRVRCKSGASLLKTLTVCRPNGSQRGA